MKAVVLDSRDDRSVVLAEDGRIEEIRGSWRPGETVELPAGRLRLPGWRRAAAVGMAACLLVGIGLASYRSYQTAVAYAAVRLSGGPALEYRLDQSNCVIAVTALEAGAEGLAQEVSSQLAGQSFEETLDMTFAILEEADIPDEAREEITAEVVVKDTDRRRDLEHTVEKVKSRHRRAAGGENHPEKEQAAAEETSGSEKEQESDVTPGLAADVDAPAEAVPGRTTEMDAPAEAVPKQRTDAAEGAAGFAREQAPEEPPAEQEEQPDAEEKPHLRTNAVSEDDGVPEDGLFPEGGGKTQVGEDTGAGTGLENAPKPEYGAAPGNDTATGNGAAPIQGEAPEMAEPPAKEDAPEEGGRPAAEAPEQEAWQPPAGREGPGGGGNGPGAGGGPR